jgi:hypothetical protein
MDSKIDIIKVNKSRFQEKLRFKTIEELTVEDIQELKEDEVNSFINVFERYFEKKGTSYPSDKYVEITSEITAMSKYLDRRLLLACDKTDWYFRMSEQVYSKLEEWKDKLEDSALLFKQDNS